MQRGLFRSRLIIETFAGYVSGTRGAIFIDDNQFDLKFATEPPADSESQGKEPPPWTALALSAAAVRELFFTE